MRIVGSSSTNRKSTTDRSGDRSKTKKELRIEQVHRSPSYVTTEGCRRKSVAGKMRTETASQGKSVSGYPECGGNRTVVGSSRKSSETSHTGWAKFEESRASLNSANRINLSEWPFPSHGSYAMRWNIYSSSIYTIAGFAYNYSKGQAPVISCECRNRYLRTKSKIAQILPPLFHLFLLSSLVVMLLQNAFRYISSVTNGRLWPSLIKRIRDTPSPNSVRTPTGRAL